MTRRHFLWSLPLPLAPLAMSQSPLFAAGASAAPLLRFGVIADCQYADAETSVKMKRFYRLSPKKLTAAVTHLNTLPLDFVINLGDTIDRAFPSFETVLPIFRQLKAPLHHVLGNHDYDVADDLKKLVRTRLGLPDTIYHTFSVKGWDFVCLDGNEVSLFSHPKASPQTAAATAYLKTLPGKPAPYNGAVSKTQLGWLRTRLDTARAEKKRVILFCHYPVFPVNAHNLWNSPEVLALVSSYKDIVAAWMNGHNHEGNYGVKDGIHFLNFKGMVDTEQGCWADVAVFADRIEVTGHEREKNKTLPASKA